MGLKMIYEGLTLKEKFGFWTLTASGIFGIIKIFLVPIGGIIVSGWFATQTPTLVTPTVTTTVAPISTITLSPLPSPVFTISPQAITPTLIMTPRPTAVSVIPIAITEIMANPCGITNKNQNEYVELYNYGDFPVDVEGWHLATTLENGESDEISSWKFRNNFSLGTDVLIDSTIINPGQYAVILSPKYHLSDDKPIMPYRFPPNTVILTIKEGYNLGNKYFGIRGELGTDANEGVYLFTGTSEFIDKVISTYSIEVTGASPHSQSKYRSGMPFGVEKCFSIERKIPDGPDTAENWKPIKNGSPGTGSNN
jgi:hypothetical protein